MLEGDYLKKIYQILLLFAALLAVSFCALNPVSAIIAFLILLVSIFELYRKFYIRNPFDRKINSIEKKESRYILSLGDHTSEILLQNYATDSDLTMALCEYICRGRSFKSAILEISSEGHANINTDDAFAPFDLRDSTVSFQKLVPSNSYEGVFYCSSLCCRTIILPPDLRSLDISSPCRIRKIKIPGNYLPELYTDRDTIEVPYGFSVQIQHDILSQSHSLDSWMSVQFVDPSGAKIDPFH